jgi:hypothetical protein
MKKTGLILIFAFTLLLSGYSQNYNDALRYSQIFYNGTARFNSMGGAFTALGGDLSAISLNPAGTGVFRSFEFSFTPQLFYNNTSSLWNKTSTSDFLYTFNLGQLGVVTNIRNTGNETGLISLNVAYSYNRTNNFNESTIINGISDSSSMSDFWGSRAFGKSKMNIPDDAWAAYQTSLIDTFPGSSTDYRSIFFNIADSTYSYGQNIRRVIINEGYSGEHSFSLGGNFSNKFYFGATLGISTIKYIGHYQHVESFDPGIVINDFKNFSYTDHLEASGTGYSLKIGTIIKPVEFLRIGLAFHSPVVYRITEYYYDNISSEFDIKGSLSYSNDPMRYKYTLTTPFRVIAGIAFQIKKLALISADYEFVDYRTSRLSNASDDYNYDTENQDIKNIFRSSSNLRLGAELRLGTVYLRGGYSYYGKAFNQNEVNKNLVNNGMSFGIGTRQEKFYFDLGFSALSGTSMYYMYNDPYLDPSTNKTVKSTFAATMGFKF